MEKDANIYVAGHRGMVGSAICRLLEREGFHSVLTRSRADLDLRRQDEVAAFFAAERPAYVFLAAAHVGGIEANCSRKGDFILDNLEIQTNVMGVAHRTGVRKLLFLGSSCIYPKFAEQPIREDSLLTGPLEPTNDAYAVAKIAGLMTARYLKQQYDSNFISMMPTNLYGPNDNFDPASSHVMAALIRKFVEAAESDAEMVTIWGTGRPRREFLHVDDAAAAALYLMENYDETDTVNIGWGIDCSILELAEMIAKVVGFSGRIVTDTDKPDGTPRKLLDVSRMKDLGWQPSITLRDGIVDAVDWYRKNRVEA